jgi:hypothetical protein
MSESRIMKVTNSVLFGEYQNSGFRSKCMVYIEITSILGIVSYIELVLNTLHHFKCF